MRGIPETGGRGARRYEVDWLRALALMGIFLFHSAMFFNYEDWHVKNNQLSFGMTLFTKAFAHWIMPLFFVLSAAAAFHSLGRRGSGRFIAERLKRLAVPFMFGTLVVLVPSQVWIERVSHHQYEGTFLEFYPHYFDGFYAFGGNFAWMGLHLWYLLMLLIFTALTLPLFLYLRGERAMAFLERLAALCTRGGYILVIAVPVYICEVIASLQPGGIGMREFGGWSVLTYLAFFVSGYAVASQPDFARAMERRWPVLLAAGMAATAALILGSHVFDLRDTAISDLGEPVLRALASWGVIAGAIGFGRRYLNFRNRLLDYANEAVLPFYILHQSVIVAAGFYMKDWDAGIAVKYLVLGSFSFAVIIALYHFIVRRLGPLRFLFGMRQAPPVPKPG